MALEQPALPYAEDALNGFLTQEQVFYHYHKHHAAYHDKLKTLLPESMQGLSLEEIILQSDGPLFNNAAQAWNHSFFWKCLSPNGGGTPQNTTLLNKLQADFGSFENFKEAFSNKAATLFGAGWCWLAEKPDGHLEIMALSNADTPLVHQARPLLTLDVWEHAYYVDFRNERPRFIKTFWDYVDWSFVAANLK